MAVIEPEKKTTAKPNTESDGCEVPGCKNVMGRNGILFMGKRVCAEHWAQDWKTINIKKLLGIKEPYTEPTLAHLRKMGLD